MVFVVAALVSAAAGVNRHKFKVSEQVPIFVNKVPPLFHTTRKIVQSEIQIHRILTARLSLPPCCNVALGGSLL